MRRIKVDTEAFEQQIVNSAEIIKDRFYFMVSNSQQIIKNTLTTHFFCVDEEFVYESFYNDFGPLNICAVYKYCQLIHVKVASMILSKKRIVHYTTGDERKRLNCALLVGCFTILHLNFSPEKAYNILKKSSTHPFMLYRDASHGPSVYKICLLDCLHAFQKAVQFGFINFQDFNSGEYKHYERKINGDLNWVLPEKFIAFCGPHDPTSRLGCAYHSPESYVPYFKKSGVKLIIRLNSENYDSQVFVRAGFQHKDLFFEDGTLPSDTIMKEFLDICENTDGVIAVHCKAGLGRTGTLICCFIMKHYRLTSEEAIAWMRLCRPGSVIAHQQSWLYSKTLELWLAGDQYRRECGVDKPLIHARGIYSFKCIQMDGGMLKKRGSNTESPAETVTKAEDLESSNARTSSDAGSSSVAQDDEPKSINPESKPDETVPVDIKINPSDDDTQQPREKNDSDVVIINSSTESDSSDTLMSVEMTQDQDSNLTMPALTSSMCSVMIPPRSIAISSSSFMELEDSDNTLSTKKSTSDETTPQCLDENLDMHSPQKGIKRDNACEEDKEDIAKVLRTQNPNY